ncbi:MAG: hypothetical protein WDO14_25395 [Bacteroidota bacterium]
MLLITPFSTQAQQKDCRKADLTVEITDSRDGKDGAIKVSSKGSDASFTLSLTGKGIGRNQKGDQFNVTTGTIKNIRPGSYNLVIYYEDPSYCSETRKVTVN